MFNNSMNGNPGRGPISIKPIPEAIEGLEVVEIFTAPKLKESYVKKEVAKVLIDPELDKLDLEELYAKKEVIWRELTHNDEAQNDSARGFYKPLSKEREGGLRKDLEKIQAAIDFKQQKPLDTIAQNAQKTSLEELLQFPALPEINNLQENDMYSEFSNEELKNELRRLLNSLRGMPHGSIPRQEVDLEMERVLRACATRGFKPDLLTS